jgi:hypothetical protein
MTLPFDTTTTIRDAAKFKMYLFYFNLSIIQCIDIQHQTHPLDIHQHKARHRILPKISSVTTQKREEMLGEVVPLCPISRRNCSSRTSRINEEPPLEFKSLEPMSPTPNKYINTHLSCGNQQRLWIHTWHQCMSMYNPNLQWSMSNDL